MRLVNSLAIAFTFLFVHVHFSALTADPVYRWTGSSTDGLWSTAGNWEQLVAGDWVAAAEAPNSVSAEVRLGNEAAGPTQTITLSENINVSFVEIQSTTTAYVINSQLDTESNEYRLTGSAAIAVRGAATSTQNLTLQVPVAIDSVEMPRLVGHSNAGASLIFERLVRMGGETLPATALFQGGPGSTVLRSDMFESGSNIRILGLGSNFFVNSPDGLNFGANILGNGPHGNHAIVLRTSHGFGVNNLGPERGNIYLRIEDGDDRDVTISATNLQREGTIHLQAPTDSSTGKLTLLVTGAIQQNQAGYGAPDLQLAADTELDLRGNQQLPSRLDWVAGIHGEGSLVKNNATTTQIGGDNTYTGGTYINAGSLQLVGGDLPLTVNSPDSEFFSGRLGPGDLHIAAGASLLMSNYNQTVSALRDDPISATGGTVDLGGSSGGTLTIDGSDTASFSGAIVGTGTVAITGGGTQTLSGTSTFTGDLNIHSGGLIVNGSLGANAAVDVTAAGILGGTGSVAGPVALGGTLAPGNSAGTLSFQGDLIFGSGAEVLFDLGSDGNDLIVLDGTGQKLSSDTSLIWIFATNGTVLEETPYQLIDWSGASSLDGFDFLLGHQQIGSPGWEGSFQFQADGLYVTFTAIPEPSAVALLLGLGALLVVRMRRR